MKPLLGVQPRSPRRESKGMATKLALLVVVLVLMTLGYNAFPGGSTLLKASSMARSGAGLYNQGFVLTDIDGNRMPLSDYAGKVLLIVNVASLCGFTKINYEQMAQLHNSYAASGLVILAYPCNQFGNQEPGSNMEVKSFAQSRGAQYPLMNKIMVNGPQTNDLWAALKTETNTPEIRWNFEKFLVGRNGRVISHHVSNEPPLSFEHEIVTALEG